MVAKRTSNKRRQMTRRDDVIQRLRRNARRLRASGIVHLSLRGPVARDQAWRESDIDVLVQIDTRKIHDLLDYAGAVGLVHDILGPRVARRERRRADVAPSALRDELRVF